MQTKSGNMWDAYDDCDLFLITTNGSVKANNRLVMGRGIAREAMMRFPDLDLTIGQRIVQSGQHINRAGANYWLYYLLIGKKIGAFQVKANWFDTASLDLIEGAVAALNAYLVVFPKLKVCLNYPGIGNGHLSIEQVAPLIALLPDNVTVWTKS